MDRIFEEMPNELRQIVMSNLKQNSVKVRRDMLGAELLNKAQNVIVFDVFDSEEHRSLAFSLTYQSDERTLSDEEVMKDFENVISKVSEKYNAKLRNE